MTTDRIDLATEIADIRDELEELQERFHSVMAAVRELPGGEHVYQRVDAYPGLRLDRDMGAGKGPLEWIEEVRAFLEEHEADEDPIPGFDDEYPPDA